MDYLILYEQEGAGCDYTIGCAITYDWIEANSPEEAFSQFCKNMDFDDEYCFELYIEGEMKLDQVLVIPVPEDNSHLFKNFVKEKKQYFELSKQKEIEEEERKNYERLKAKFEQ